MQKYFITSNFIYSPYKLLIRHPFSPVKNKIVFEKGSTFFLMKLKVILVLKQNKYWPMVGYK